MAFRSLTDIYILMRNNAIVNRDLFHDNQNSDDKTALVVDLETGSVKSSSRVPPEWINDVEEINFEMTKIMNKLKDLSNLHDKHLNRPTMDDNVDEEKSIDNLTQEITNMVSQCKSNIRRLSTKNSMDGFRSAQTDKRLMKSVVGNLAQQLQELTTNFRQSQNVYLKKIQSRKERSNMLVDSSKYLSSNALMTEEDSGTGFDANDFNRNSNRQEQLQLGRLNERLIKEREDEINHIVKSINDINELFKDLATMVVDQGTVVDRIDFNIERVSQSVDSGLVQLQKAAKYQKASRKMYIITVLMIIFIVLFVLLIITKF